MRLNRHHFPRFGSFSLVSIFTGPDELNEHAIKVVVRLPVQIDEDFDPGILDNPSSLFQDPGYSCGKLLDFSAWCDVARPCQDVHAIPARMVHLQSGTTPTCLRSLTLFCNPWDFHQTRPAPPPLEILNGRFVCLCNDPHSQVP
jgi:hypothetical protein